MTVAENLILGAETGTAFKVDRKEAVRITTELSDKYNLKVEAKEKSRIFLLPCVRSLRS